MAQVPNERGGHNGTPIPEKERRRIMAMRRSEGSCMLSKMPKGQGEAVKAGAGAEAHRARPHVTRKRDTEANCM